ncbi:hypothetical protein VP01_2922g2 [Puccinia sorghi]|uniref:Uncharacterized protein n=1 Tax=Puccinia sorghi TaxID=27349 RepID=A0A0L6V216_9BASI|nr:hypothetical protein VP01_2922g2 [Puccinia sorghi]
MLNFNLLSFPSFKNPLRILTLVFVTGCYPSEPHLTHAIYSNTPSPLTNFPESSSILALNIQPEESSTKVSELPTSEKGYKYVSHFYKAPKDISSEINQSNIIEGSCRQKSLVVRCPQANLIVGEPASLKEPRTYGDLLGRLDREHSSSLETV